MTSLWVVATTCLLLRSLRKSGVSLLLGLAGRSLGLAGLLLQLLDYSVARLHLVFKLLDLLLLHANRLLHFLQAAQNFCVGRAHGLFLGGGFCGGRQNFVGLGLQMHRWRAQETRPKPCLSSFFLRRDIKMHSLSGSPNGTCSRTRVRQGRMVAINC